MQDDYNSYNIKLYKFMLLHNKSYDRYACTGTSHIPDSTESAIYINLPVHTHNYSHLQIRKHNY